MQSRALLQLADQGNGKARRHTHKHNPTASAPHNAEAVCFTLHQPETASHICRNHSPSNLTGGRKPTATFHLAKCHPHKRISEKMRKFSSQSLQNEKKNINLRSVTHHSGASRRPEAAKAASQPQDFHNLHNTLPHCSRHPGKTKIAAANHLIRRTLI